MRMGFSSRGSAARPEGFGGVSSWRSSPRAAIICMPTGRPSRPPPQGMEMAGAIAWLTNGVNTAWPRGSTATPPIAPARGDRWPGDAGRGRADQQIEAGEELADRQGDLQSGFARAGHVGPAPLHATFDLPRRCRGRTARGPLPGLAMKVREAHMLQRHQCIFVGARRPYRIRARDGHAGLSQVVDGLLDAAPDVVVDRDIEAEARAEGDAQLIGTAPAGRGSPTDCGSRGSGPTIASNMRRASAPFARSARWSAGR